KLKCIINSTGIYSLTGNPKPENLVDVYFPVRECILVKHKNKRVLFPVGNQFWLIFIPYGKNRIESVYSTGMYSLMGKLKCIINSTGIYSLTGNPKPETSNP